MSLAYEFGTQDAIGAEDAEILDTYFSQRWYITPTSKRRQRQEIDRDYVLKQYDSIKYTVEYKADRLAATYGNLFIELLSNDATGALGWALRCDADLLFIFVRDDMDVYILSVPNLKFMVPYWCMKYEIGKSPNNGYRTHGLKVPRAEVEQSVACLGKINLKGKTKHLGQQHRFF
jgi:hypothetical protein